MEKTHLNPENKLKKRRILVKKYTVIGSPAHATELSIGPTMTEL
jgi:hypothetical protein